MIKDLRVPTGIELTNACGRPVSYTKHDRKIGIFKPLGRRNLTSSQRPLVYFLRHLASVISFSTLSGPSHRDLTTFRPKNKLSVSRISAHEARTLT